MLENKLHLNTKKTVVMVFKSYLSKIIIGDGISLNNEHVFSQLRKIAWHKHYSLSIIFTVTGVYMYTYTYVEF